VNSTPTVFVNGRRLVGADPHLLEQYINYELAQQKPVKIADRSKREREEAGTACF